MLPFKLMSDASNRFEFTAVVMKEERWYVSLCPELDVASQGQSRAEARRNLAEAVSLYLESCFENNLPYLRPVPADSDPRVTAAESVELFPLHVTFRVRTIA